jgi:hypothetical protein
MCDSQKVRDLYALSCGVSNKIKINMGWAYRIHCKNNNTKNLVGRGQLTERLLEHALFKLSNDTSNKKSQGREQARTIFSHTTAPSTEFTQTAQTYFTYHSPQSCEESLPI